MHTILSILFYRLFHHSSLTRGIHSSQ